MKQFVNHPGHLPDVFDLHFEYCSVPLAEIWHDIIQPYDPIGASHIKDSLLGLCLYHGPP